MWFYKNVNLLKTNASIKMINLLRKIYHFVKKYKLTNKQWKCVISEKHIRISAGLQYVLVLLDRSWQVRTCPISDFWSNFACFGFKIICLTEFLDDSAWLLLEKLKKHVMLIKNFNIWPTILKICFCLELSYHCHGTQAEPCKCEKQYKGSKKCASPRGSRLQLSGGFNSTTQHSKCQAPSFEIKNLKDKHNILKITRA